MIKSYLVGKQKSSTEHTSCLDDWIGYLGKCFYFSENTTTWTASQNFCVSHEATLAVFHTTKELVRQYFWTMIIFSEVIAGVENAPWKWEWSRKDCLTQHRKGPIFHISSGHKKQLTYISGSDKIYLTSYVKLTLMIQIIRQH